MSAELAREPVLVQSQIALSVTAIEFSEADVLRVAYRHAKRNVEAEMRGQGLRPSDQARVKIIYEVEAE